MTVRAPIASLSGSPTQMHALIQWPHNGVGGPQI